MNDAFKTPQNLLLLGGTSEIGLEIAQAWVARGCRQVVLAARQSERRTRAAVMLRQQGAIVREVDFEAQDTASHAGLLRSVAQGGDIDAAVVASGC